MVSGIRETSFPVYSVNFIKKVDRCESLNPQGFRVEDISWMVCLLLGRCRFRA